MSETVTMHSTPANYRIRTAFRAMDVRLGEWVPEGEVRFIGHAIIVNPKTDMADLLRRTGWRFA
jgi:hypothetical protein